MYVIEVKTQKVCRCCARFEGYRWGNLHDSSGKVYTFETEAEAQKMRDMCYPEQTEEEVRVKEIFTAK